MQKNNEYFLLKTINEIDVILEYSKNISIESLIDNPVILDAIVFRMIQMSEHMNKITNDFKIIHKEIDWNSIKGFRNKLVHNYGAVDLKFIFNAISMDIPRLKKQIHAII